MERKKYFCKLSIIIPVYNSEKYLEECLDSIKINNNNDIEVILIDDGSTDNSSKIYNKYEKHTNFCVIKQINSGVSHARNKGIEVANGEWIMFVDSDDFLENNWYKKIEDELKNDDSIMIRFSSKFSHQNFDIFDALKACIAVKSPLSGCSIMSPCSIIIKKDFLHENNIRFSEDIFYGEDMLFNFEMLAKIKKLRLVDIGIYNYRKNLTSSTHTFNPKIIESDFLFHHKLKRIMENYLDISEWIKYYDQTVLSGIYICFYKFSLNTMNIGFADKIFENQEYTNILNKYNICSLNTSFYKKMFYRLVKNKKYHSALFIIKCHNYLKKILHKKNNETIVKLI